MNFYAGVPRHRFLLLGSHAWGRPDERSDVDVVICVEGDRDHPYFQDLVRSLGPAMPPEGRLDLMWDEPERHRFTGVAGHTAIDPGPEYYAAMKAAAREITIFDLGRMARAARAMGPCMIDSREQFQEREAAKGAVLDALVRRHRQQEPRP